MAINTNSRVASQGNFNEAEWRTRVDLVVPTESLPHGWTWQVYNHITISPANSGHLASANHEFDSIAFDLAERHRLVADLSPANHTIFRYKQSMSTDVFAPKLQP